LKPATAGHYHSDAGVAQSLGSKPVTRITATGVVLERTFLDKILNQNEGGIILVEAREATDKPLRLEVWRNNVPVATLELPLSFAGVETMFRHVNLVGAVGMTEETSPRGSLPNWSEKLENKQAFLFVHGYNVNQKQARGWQAEFFKRLWWSGSKAQFWGVTWYGFESQVPVANFTPNYQLNVIHAFGTAPILKQFIDELRAKTAVTSVNVAAHSLGNLVVSSAISDHSAPIDRYFMLNAAVAAEAYDGEKGEGHVVQSDDGTAFLPHTEWNKERGKVYPPRLWASNWHELFPAPSGNPATDDARAKLTWRDRFAPKSTTNYYDFHSAGEEVLGYDERHIENTPSLFGVLSTELNTYLHITKPGELRQPNGYQTWIYQEQLKGRTTTGKVLGSNYGGWGFNNFILKKTPAPNGNGPRIAPLDMTPENAIAAEPYLLDTDLQAEPFFRPGGYWTRVGTWNYDPVVKKNFWINGPLRQLYGQSTGSAFASTHRDTLLARMIPAMSPAAGRIPVPRLTADAGEERNFDMNGTAIRPSKDIEGNPRWPETRGRDFRWWHTDLREVAYPYVRGLYQLITAKGNLGEPAP
ncbi:MAG: alpha/beta hydrolase, partial [Nitrospira sp.]|nr:alpha/beta hydrolase [Nitrospira sp.]